MAFGDFLKKQREAGESLLRQTEEEVRDIGHSAGRGSGWHDAAGSRPMPKPGKPQVRTTAATIAAATEASKRAKEETLANRTPQRGRAVAIPHMPDTEEVRLAQALTRDIRVLTHSSIKICCLLNDTRIYFDPFEILDDLHDATAVFITHSHYDHYSPKDLKKIGNSKTGYVVPPDLAARIKEDLHLRDDQVIVAEVGKVGMARGVQFTALPAATPGRPYHPRENNWCGYLCQINRRYYYVAGDTDNLPELHDIECDVAFVPVGGTYTMDVQQAADLINAIHPKAAVPTHYGTVVGDMGDGARFAELVDEDIPVIRYW